MFTDFIEELNKALTELGVDDTARYIEDYTARYNALRASGKSEFESVLALGDPVANAHAIAGYAYSADQQIANNLLLETNKTEIELAEIEKNIDKPQKPLSNGEKTFYGVLIAIAACLIVAFVFVTALIGIISVGYLFLSWFDFVGINRFIVFGFAVAGLLLFVIFAITAAAMIYKLYRFTADNMTAKKTSA